MITREPNPAHYPKWLREYIFPDLYPMEALRNRADRCNFERHLESIFKMRRSDAIADVLSECILQNIRYEIKLHEVESEYATEIERLKERIDTLEKKSVREKERRCER